MLVEVFSLREENPEEQIADAFNEGNGTSTPVDLRHGERRLTMRL